MNELIPKHELARALRMREGAVLVEAVMKWSSAKDVNKLYQALGEHTGRDFAEQVLNHLELQVTIKDGSMDLIPEKGGCVVVANHPFGALDGLILIAKLTERRPDLKIMANFLLGRIQPLGEFFIGVNPFDDQISSKSSRGGMRDCLRHVQAGGCLVIFPAGEVASKPSLIRPISDTKWKSPALKLIQRLQVPVVPVHIQGGNSYLFHLLGLIHPSLRTLQLPKELLRKRGASIQVVIGKAITKRETESFEDERSFGNYLRARVFALQEGGRVKRNVFQALPRQQRHPQEVIAASDPAVIQAEIDAIEDYKLFDQDTFSVYAVKAAAIPQLLVELGRLRELTFRAVGEGTNRELDLDRFDYHYYHLLLWDHQERCLVGAYRIGIGSEILEMHGKRGFYTSTLFRFQREFRPYLAQSMELGRSFVRAEYQRKRLPLFLLWQGIRQLVAHFKEVKYIIGPVSISNHYAPITQQMMVEFLQHHYGKSALKNWVNPKNKLRFKRWKEDLKPLREKTNAELRQFEHVIAQVDSRGASLPVLIKKYLDQNARLLAFNRDPDFNDSIDVFMMLDVAEMPDLQ
ncbi:MAG: lysophospholipid acyltransferase family protein [Flavobacteriales bacterium]